MAKRIYNHIHKCSCSKGETYSKTKFLKHIEDEHKCTPCKNGGSECYCEEEDMYCWRCDELHEVCICGDKNVCHDCKKNIIDDCTCKDNNV